MHELKRGYSITAVPYNELILFILYSHVRLVRRNEIIGNKVDEEMGEREQIGSIISQIQKLFISKINNNVLQINTIIYLR